ncbi:MAG: YfiR family protein [Acinetobacter sp.]|nr:YfiR family protein [Acinetobacter sp.]
MRRFYSLISFVVFSLLMGFASSVQASSDQHFQKIVNILNYSNLPKTAHICVVKDIPTGSALSTYLRTNKFTYQAKHVTEESLLKSSCQVIYFPNTAPSVQNKLINAYPTPILTISERNIDCEVGSAFCLYIRNNAVAVKVNLNRLSSSKVKIDPRVLHLLSKKD